MIPDKQVGILWEMHSFEHTPNDQCSLPDSGQCVVIALIHKLIGERVRAYRALPKSHRMKSPILRAVRDFNIYDLVV